VANSWKFGRPVPAQGSGRYWGPPADGAAAIRELQNLRESGTNVVVFTGDIFWWLDYYEGMRDYLAANARCLHQDERFIVFDLQSDL
jgi:hypothetical protein